MKTQLLLALLPLLLIGCAHTKATAEYVDIQANCSYVEWHGGPRPSLIMRDVNHSTPTRAGGSLIGTTGAAMTGVAGALLTNGLVR